MRNFLEFRLTGGLAAVIQYIVLGVGTSVMDSSASLSSGARYSLDKIYSY
ncbi:MAG: hypothetical protein P8N18_05225 [Hellea sp.]|nr:hypothetical protein [Hellea sp.]